MRIKMFYHSLLSDWNHGNAHFLRGIATELIRRGNSVVVYEPENSWSFENLVKDHGDQAISEFYKYYPLLESTRYDSKLDLDEALADADVVIVHEWNDHELVKNIGLKRKNYSFKLLFHDTHHRAVTERKSMSSYDLTNYDGVLAFGNVIRDIYLKEKWSKRAWTWHEAADTSLFTPQAATETEGDIVWIGNWGDDERTAELLTFLIEPIRELKLKARFYGVRYPAHALKSLERAGIEYGGWLPNFKVPETFARYKLTAHVPRRPYVEALPGIPTIRPFEAMACGIPLISSPWNDKENLFRGGKDFRFANNKRQMIELMENLLSNETLAKEQTSSGLETIQQKHNCSVRVDELYDILKSIEVRNPTKRTVSL